MYEDYEKIKTSKDKDYHCLDDATLYDMALKLDISYLEHLYTVEEMKYIQQQETHIDKA